MTSSDIGGTADSGTIVVQVGCAVVFRKTQHSSGGNLKQVSDSPTPV
jgi:hypothetical protein